MLDGVAKAPSQSEAYQMAQAAAQAAASAEEGKTSPSFIETYQTKQREHIMNCMSMGVKPCPNALPRALTIIKAHLKREASKWFDDRCTELKYRLVNNVAIGNNGKVPTNGENSKILTTTVDVCQDAMFKMNSYLIERDQHIEGLMELNIDKMSVEEKKKALIECRAQQQKYRDQDIAVSSLWGDCQGHIAALVKRLTEAVEEKWHTTKTTKTDDNINEKAENVILYNVLMEDEDRKYVCQPIPKSCDDQLEPRLNKITNECEACEEATPRWDPNEEKCVKKKIGSKSKTKIILLPFQVRVLVCPGEQEKDPVNPENCKCPDERPKYIGYHGLCCRDDQMYDRTTKLCGDPPPICDLPKNYRNILTGVCECPPNSPHLLQPGTCSTCTHPKIRYIPEGGEVDAPKCTGTSGSMTIQSEAAKDVSSSETSTSGSSTDDISTGGTTDVSVTKNENSSKEKTPADETLADETSADETPANDTPVDDTTANDTPVDATPTDDTPANRIAKDTSKEEVSPSNKVTESTDSTESTETPVDETVEETVKGQSKDDSDSNSALPSFLQIQMTKQCNDFNGVANRDTCCSSRFPKCGMSEKGVCLLVRHFKTGDKDICQEQIENKDEAPTVDFPKTNEIDNQVHSSAPISTIDQVDTEAEEAEDMKRGGTCACPYEFPHFVGGQCINCCTDIKGRIKFVPDNIQELEGTGRCECPNEDERILKNADGKEMCGVCSEDLPDHSKMSRFVPVTGKKKNVFRVIETNLFERGN